MAARILEPTDAALAEAARILRAGGLVAFPTETVYGLGADARDAAAVRRIFSAKGRPADNPIIVHVADVAGARALAATWPPAAERLARAHWPGPLTLVVEKTDALSAVVTAGGPTVGLRVPAHPVARALLVAADLPIAAPSANRSEAISPTTAAHVADSLGGWIDDLLVLDGGACPVGIESAVVDVTGAAPRVLRPGTLSLEALGLDASQRPDSVGAADPAEPRTRTPAADRGPARSPGQRARHYAPSKPLRVVDAAALGTLRAGEAVLRLGDDPARAAAKLYAELRRLERDPQVERIFVERPPSGDAWAGIRDRLRRAASD